MIIQWKGEIDLKGLDLIDRVPLGFLKDQLLLSFLVSAEMSPLSDFVPDVAPYPHS